MSAVYRLLLRTLTTKGRLAAMLGADVLIVGLAAVLAANGRGAAAGIALIDDAGFLLLVPVAALLFGASVFGEPVEDGNLPYITLRPIPRWRVVLAGTLAVVTVAYPLAVVPLVLVAVITGASAQLILAVLAATALGVCAYGSLFLALGIRSRRALLYGLAYVLLWEAIVAGVSRQLGRTAIRTHVRSLFNEMTRSDLNGTIVAGSTAVIVLLTITAMGVLLATRYLKRIDLE